MTGCVRLRRAWLVLLLVPVLVLWGCGDDGDGPTEPEGSSEELSVAAEFFSELSSSMTEAAGLMFAGGGTVAGEQGAVVVTGSTVSFDGYSPDGEVIIEGDLQVDLLVQPVAVTGQLELTGEPGGTADVNVTIDLTSTPIAYGGTITLDGVEYDVAEIVAEAEAYEDADDD